MNLSRISLDKTTISSNSRKHSDCQQEIARLTSIINKFIEETNARINRLERMGDDISNGSIFPTVTTKTYKPYYISPSSLSPVNTTTVTQDKITIKIELLGDGDSDDIYIFGDEEVPITLTNKEIKCRIFDKRGLYVGTAEGSLSIKRGKYVLTLTSTSPTEDDYEVPLTLTCTIPR